ncbi:MAG: hypothetical protein SFY69_01900 [Planctomycetota bacterium]|nr:hypothetical protein [Planctomycetota bacterium]
MSEPITRRAPAKVNLALSLGPPEPAHAPRPGWHPICTWVACIDLWDDVTVTPLAPGAPRAFAVSWAPDALRPTPIDWPPEADLARRAHDLLEAHLGRPLAARVEVRKRIPVGAGLGGGSSDAAATLLALRTLFVPDLPVETLAGIGAQLGSDVAFFIDPHPQAPPAPAIVEGFGERVERVERAEGDVVLVVPPYPCATGAVYRAFDEVIAQADQERRQEWELMHASGGGRPPQPHHLRADLVRARLARSADGLDGRQLFNDLTPAACRVEPRLAPLLRDLSRATRLDAHLTGSGSCVFIQTSRPAKTMEQVRRAAPADCAVQAHRLV